MSAPTRMRPSRFGCPRPSSGVPTQMSARSESRRASSADVVADSCPSATSRASNSPSPGSTTGAVPELIIVTFSATTSTPTTRWPALARQVAETHPTYPSPKTLTFIGVSLGRA